VLTLGSPLKRAVALGMTNLPKAMATPYAALWLFTGALCFLKHLCHSNGRSKIQQRDYFEALRMLEVPMCVRAGVVGTGR
jgi:hypothetical protein